MAPAESEHAKLQIPRRTSRSWKQCLLVAQRTPPHSAQQLEEVPFPRWVQAKSDERRLAGCLANPRRLGPAATSSGTRGLLRSLTLLRGDRVVRLHLFFRKEGSPGPRSRSRFGIPQRGSCRRTLGSEARAREWRSAWPRGRAAWLAPRSVAAKPRVLRGASAQSQARGGPCGAT